MANLSHPNRRSLRPPGRIVLAAVLLGGVAALPAMAAAGSTPPLATAAWPAARVAPASGHDFGTPVFSADARGDLVTIGNVTTTCDPAYENDRWTAAESRAACEGATRGEVGLARYDGAPMPPINNRLSMVHVDADDDRGTFASSSAVLAVPDGAEVLWAGLHWNAATDVPQADQLYGSTHEISPPSETDRFLVRLATPRSGGYVELDAAGPDGDTWDDTNPGGTTSYGAFVDVTDLVRAGGPGRYQVADVQSCQGFGGCFGSWSLTVAFADEDEPPRNLNVWHGWQLTSPSVDDGEQTFEVSGITPPPNGVVQARIGVVQADGDRGLGPDSLDISSPSSPSWTTFETADRPLAAGEDDWFNSTVNAYGARRGDATATPNLLANLNQDIALVQDDTVIANADTSFRFRVRTSGTESLYSQVVHAAVDLYAPQIGLTKAVEPTGPVAAGDEVTWTLQVRNDGIDPIRRAVVTDPLPDGLSYVPGSIRFVDGGPADILGAKTDALGDDEADYDAAAHTLRFRVGTGATAADGGTMEVAPAADGSHDLTISFRTRVDAAPDVTTTNAAQAHGEGRELDDPFGPLVTDAVDDAPIATGPVADLGITKGDGDAVVRAVGDRFTYELVARNAGPSPATGVTLTDELDPMVRFVDGDDGCAAAGQLVTCAVGPLAVGADAIRSFVVEVVELPGPGATIPNVAVIDGDQPNPDCVEPTPSAACNQDDEETPQPAIDLGITKTDDGAVVRQVGDTFTYRLEASNAGPDDATGVTIVDELDPRLAFAGSERCAADGATVTCGIGDLAAGASTEVTFEVEVVELPDPGEAIPNVATVHGAEPDPDCTDETPDARCNADDEDTPRPPAPEPPTSTTVPTTTPRQPTRTGTPAPRGDGWLPLTGAPTAAWAAGGVALLAAGAVAAIAGARTRRARPAPRPDHTHPRTAAGTPGTVRAVTPDVPPSLARRTVLQAGLGAALVLAGVGCSSDDDSAEVDQADDDVTTPIPRPAAMVRTSWATDPWTLGAYSYLPVGASPDDRTALRAPVDDVLWFAGEAIDADSPSTVHGAQASGRAAADGIAEVAEPGETVVVVGAGMAGAAAARSLVDAGFEVVVVEARDRTGGRTDTVQPDGWTIPVERGASWIHDTSASDLADQAAALDIATVAFSYDDLALDADGEPMGEDARAQAEAAVEAAVAWADEEGDEDLSLADAITASGAADDVDPVVLEHHLRTEIATEYGADADELSSWWTFEEGSLGDDLLVVGGYGRLVEDHLEGIEVRLDWPVSTIDRADDRPAVTGPGGERLQADRIVVTVPLGVLKADRIAFEPPLPDTHRTAIERLGMGLLDKVWLRFDEQWWTSEVEQWTRVGDGPDDPYIEWFDIAAATGEPVLLALVGGSTARAWAERSDDDVLDAAVASLQRFADAGLRA